MSLIKKTSQQTFLYTFFQGLGFGVSFISFPIMTRLFSVQEYGDLALVNATIAILLALAKCGVTTSFVRHYAAYQSTNSLGLLYSSALAGGVVVSLAIVLIYTATVFLLQSRIEPYLLNIFILAGLLILIRNLENLFKAFFRAEERVLTLNVFTLVYRVGSITTGLLACVLIIKGLYGYFVGVVLFEACMIAGIGFTFYRDMFAGITNAPKEILSKLYVYGFPLVFFEASSLIHDFSDRFLIKYFLGSAEVGIYSVGYNFSTYVQGLLTAPLWMAIFPIYTKLWESSGRRETEIFLSGLLKYYLCVAIGVIFLASTLSKELITLLASQKYAEAADLIPFIVTGVMIHGSYHIIGASFFLTAQTRKLAVYTLSCAALNMALNAYFIPVFGITGAAFTALVSYVTLTVLITTNSRAILTITWPIRDVAYYLVAGVVMAIALNAIHFENTLLDIACKLVVGTLVYAICVLAYDRDARRMVASFNLHGWRDGA